jgi:tetratricopeptide (TPR) repeat protein
LISYGYKNLGIYHFDKGEFDEALQLFLKAKKLDDMTHAIDDWIKSSELEIAIAASGK